MKLIIPPTRTARYLPRSIFFFILSIIFGSIQSQLFAQWDKPQNKGWAFTGHAGLNFTPGPGATTMYSACLINEGNASVADDNGNLLFYVGAGSLGPNVYTRTHVTMPNGIRVAPFKTFSCTQAAAIVPMIGNPNKFYVFSLEHGGEIGWFYTAPRSRLYYCIVDMTLNGGLGDVIASTIATPLDSNLSEKMTVVAGDNCDIWLLTHDRHLPQFKAFNISSSGISAPVISTATGEIPSGPSAYKVGTIKVSPDRTKVVNCVMNGGYTGGMDRLELLNFNPATGIVTGCQVLNNYGNQYDAEFSPDNSKLYTHLIGSRIYQYDLSLLPSISSVIASEYLVYTSPDRGGQMKLGPDGKIYIQTASSYINCINSPNLPGSLCDYALHVFHIGASSPDNLGMPNQQIVGELTDTIKSRTDTTVCSLGGPITAPVASSWYIWNTGATTRSISITDTGIYWVKSADGCYLRIDTFAVNTFAATFTATSERDSFCSGSSLTLTAPPGFVSHVWSTGVSTSAISVSSGGTYIVADTDLAMCTLQTDTFHVTAVAPSLVSTTTTAGYCWGTSTTLSAPAGFTSYHWSTGATTPIVSVSSAGSYWVVDTVFSTCILNTDTFHVSAISHTLVSISTPATFCTGSSASLAAPGSFASHFWSTGATTPAISVSSPGMYWVSDTVSSTCTLYTDTFHVTATPLSVSTVASTYSVCLGATGTLSAPATFVTPKWSTGATTASISVTSAGTYWVTDTSLVSCVVSVDTFHVNTPNPTASPSVTTTSYCSGSAATLLAPASYTAPRWSVGATTSSITVTSPGVYWVSDTNLTTCIVSVDTFHVTSILPVLIPTVTPTSFCIGSSATLAAPAAFATHVWNTGATTSSIIVLSGGTFWVSDTVFSSCTLNVDTFHVAINLLAPLPGMTADSLCSGTSMTLTAPAGFVTHDWNTGASTPSITVGTSGVYWVADTNLVACTVQIHNFLISPKLPTMLADVTPVHFCTAMPATLTAPAGFSSPTWNTGATAPSITVVAGGNYWVSDTDLTACTIRSDTFDVTTTAPSMTDTSENVTFCSGKTKMLSAPSGYTSPRWSTGAGTSAISIADAGTYWVNDIDLVACTVKSDTFYASVKPSPIVDIGRDTSICPGISLLLTSAGSIGTFLWSTGSTAASITVQSGGRYHLTVTLGECTNTDTINVNVLPAPPPLVLGPDTVLCNGDILELSCNGQEAFWSTGVTARSITVKDAGTYTASITNECGRSIGEINVSFEPCDIDFPSAFTPNGDGRNDIARAMGFLSAFRNYKLAIYNRFGQRVFYTEDIYAGWDGLFNGVPSDLGTYFYMINFTLKGKKKMIKGDLTLIR
ncbi:MAG: gliding motility-associated C-terminal domain-containing protein [Taibaiella sp.]|nr:gliding motility-associated C-terminal domain-containing protein [Taibaiella sp.]